MNELSIETTAPRPSKIQVKGLVKTFRTNGVQVEVLTGVHLDIFRGETLAIAGASGVGKSTLLHILGTLERPTAGQVLWDGADVFSLDENLLAAFRNRKAGFVFQLHQLLPEFNVLENVMMPALIARLPNKPPEKWRKLFCSGSALRIAGGIGFPSFPGANSSGWPWPEPW